MGQKLDISNMPEVQKRRPYFSDDDPEDSTCYKESDRDWMLNNSEAVVWFLEKVVGDDKADSGIGSAW